MTPVATLRYEQLSPAEAARVDAACDRFEKAWKEAQAQGATPRIPAYLDGTDEPERSVLVRELIAVDQACRQRYGVPVRPEDYHGLCGTDEIALGLTTQVRGDTTKPVPAPATNLPQLPGFQLLEVVGEGGMGVVYRARQAALERDVAVKMLRDASRPGTEQRERFHQEARALARLQHPHLVQVHEFGDLPSLNGTTAQPYLVLEYVSGGSLANYLRGAAPSPHEAAGLVATLAEAIHYAHGQGIIHRDLKPANILLEGSGIRDQGLRIRKETEGSSSPIPNPQSLIPKITDFGLAKSGTEAHLTQTGDLLGTPSYMAPEQTLGKAATITPAVDVYGLGTILYECLTGRPPFKGETALTTLQQVQRDDPVSPRRLRLSVPRDLETICLKCLRKEPAKRYASAQELAVDLRRFLEGRPIMARPVSMPARLRLWALRRPAVASLAALVLVTLLGGLTGVVAAWRKAVTARYEADGNWRTAMRALKDAANAREAAEKAEKNKTAVLDRQRIINAHHAWLADNWQGARGLLDKADGLANTWEWRYVNRLCRLGRLPFADHTKSATGVAYSPDGRYLASLGLDQVVLVRDLMRGTSRSLSLPPGHQLGHTRLAFRSDGRQLATVASGFILTWDLDQDAPPTNWRGHEKNVRGTVSYSPDGHRLATGCHDTACIWDVTTRVLIREFKTVPYIYQVSWSPDGLLLACASRDGYVRIWETDTGKERAALPTNRFAFCVVFSPDGRLFAWASMQGVVAVFETDTFRRVATLGSMNSFVECLAFSPDGRTLAAGSLNGPAKLWDVASTRTLATLHGHSSGVWSLAFSPDGARLATAGRDGCVHEWDVTDEQEVATLRPIASGRMAALAFSPNRKYLVTGQHDRVRLWNLESRTRVFETLRMNTFLSVAFHPEGKLFAGGDTQGTVSVWDTSGRLVGELKRNGYPLALRFTGDGDQLLVAGWDNGVYRWEPGNPEPPSLVFGPLGVEDRGQLGTAIPRATFSPEGRWLAYRETGQSLDIWDLAACEKRLTLADTPPSTQVLAFDGRGELLAIATGQGAFQVRDVATGNLIAEPPGHPTTIFGLAFTPDGSRLASTSTDGTVKLWDVRAGVEVLSLREQATYDTAVGFSPDGELLVAGGWDGHPRVWSVADLAHEKAEARRQRQKLWHERQAAQAVQERHWYAARHHHGLLNELELGKWQHLAARGRANAELGAWDEAAADFDAALAAPGCPALVYYNRARLYLRAGEIDAYRALCQRMLNDFAGREASPTNSVVWLCALAPTPPVAPDRLVRLAEFVLTKSPPRFRHLYLNTLALTLYRAGQPKEALRQLDEAMTLQGKGGLIEDWLLLALAHHRLEQFEQAERWYRRADDEFKQVAALPSLRDGRALTWELRVELDQLFQEARAVLGKKTP